MRKALVAAAVLFIITFAFVPALSQAQESDISPAWLKGTWQGTTRSSFVGDDRHEYVIAEDGTFKGDIQSVRGGWIEISGSYRIESGKLILEGKIKTGPPGFFGSKYEIYLTRNGKLLEGKSYSYATGKYYPMSLQRVK